MNATKIFGMSIIIIIAAVILTSAEDAMAAELPNILSGQNLTVGTSGQSVVVLQGLLSEMGYLNVPRGIPFGYYGSLTKNAVAMYQAKVNVTPAVGFYGPVTKVAMYSDFDSKGWLNILGWKN